MRKVINKSDITQFNLGLSILCAKHAEKYPDEFQANILALGCALIKDYDSIHGLRTPMSYKIIEECTEARCSELTSDFIFETIQAFDCAHLNLITDKNVLYVGALAADLKQMLRMIDDDEVIQEAVMDAVNKSLSKGELFKARQAFYITLDNRPDANEYARYTIFK